MKKPTELERAERAAFGFGIGAGVAIGQWGLIRPTDAWWWIAIAFALFFYQAWMIGWERAAQRKVGPDA